jgi:hypothetical protein
MLPMSSSEDDWERRLLEPCTASLFRLDVDPVSLPELPCRPGTAQGRSDSKLCSLIKIVLLDKDHTTSQK